MFLFLQAGCRIFAIKAKTGCTRLQSVSRADIEKTFFSYLS